MFFGDHRIAQLVVLVIELDDGAGQRRALVDAEALGERTGGDIADDHFAGDDLDFADQLLAHVHGADEVGRHADLVQAREDIFRDTVVEDALAFNRRVFLIVEGGGVILEMLDESAGFGAFVKDLGLALINASATAHVMIPIGWPEILRFQVGAARRQEAERPGIASPTAAELTLSPPAIQCDRTVESSP